MTEKKGEIRHRRPKAIGRGDNGGQEGLIREEPRFLRGSSVPWMGGSRPPAKERTRDDTDRCMNTNLLVVPLLRPPKRIGVIQSPDAEEDPQCRPDQCDDFLVTEVPLREPVDKKGDKRRKNPDGE